MALKPACFGQKAREQPPYPCRSHGGSAYGTVEVKPAAAVLLLFHSNNVPAFRSVHMLQRYHLSHTDAMKIVDALRRELEQQGKGAAIAVADSQGELLAFLRTDGCKLPSINIAINKAYTAAREQKPSREVGDAARSENFPMTNFGDLRYTAWGGGVPIVYQGQVVGAVGVSGLPEAEDMVLAAKGAALLAGRVSDVPG